ncbi:halo-CC-star protein HcsS [Halococcus sp. AFM35]|uniref:halo-CC-star protein HcsS n=1 Tax=Halococcus sp. AFM35 TaxID=3421653 RepID=UPI003EBD1737
MSTTESDVLAAAENLGEALADTQAESTESEFEFEPLLEQCNEAISNTTGVEYGEVCETSSDCC